MLIARNLSKTYKTNTKKSLFSKSNIKYVEAVRDVSLKIEQGKIVGLLGINGAGKTTTIKMLSTMIEPTSGSLQINDVDGIKQYKKVKEKINVIAGGERNLYWRLTAVENLQYFGGLYSLDKDVLNSRISRLIELVGLTEAKDTPVERYSKGMKQRLQIARGLINDPEFLFLDEPTLGLDISIAKELRSYIRHIADTENKGVLLTTHYISEAEELCDYIYIIDKGAIINEGTPDGLKRMLKTSNEILYKIDKFAKLPFDEIEKLIEKDGSLSFANDSKTDFQINSDTEYTADIIKILTKHDISVFEMKRSEAKLEDLLLELLTDGGKNEEFTKDSKSRNSEAAS